MTPPGRDWSKALGKAVADALEPLCAEIETLRGQVGLQADEIKTLRTELEAARDEAKKARELAGVGRWGHEVLSS